LTDAASTRLDLCILVGRLTETETSELSRWVHLCYQLVTERGEHKGLNYCDLLWFQHHTSTFCLHQQWNLCQFLAASTCCSCAESWLLQDPASTL